MTGYERLCEALKVEPTPHANSVTQCPAHDDQRASLSFREGDDGAALLMCFAGCPTPKVVEALGLTMADLFTDRRDGGHVVDVYVYRDEDSKPLLRVLRTHPKGFTQERWNERTQTWMNGLGDTKRVPYRLPDVLRADHVWLVEGEKDANRLDDEFEGLSTVASTLLGGTGKWREEYTPYFVGKRVSIIADRDEAGINGALKVKNVLRGVAKGRADLLIPPEGYKDITEVLEAGMGLGDLERYVAGNEEAFEPLDWHNYKVPKTDWLMEPYIPRSSRVLLFGPAGSMKSLWAMWVCTQLAREGHHVAYFSLEMMNSQVAKRLNKLQPPPDLFKLYRRFSFTDPGHLEAAIELLRGFSLIVVDSWTAAATQMDMRESNQGVARLDREVFIPLVEETGASLLILDNTGHPVITDKGTIQMQHARGASAKGDKVDLSILFERPDEEDSQKVRIKVKKMRLDRAQPRPVTVRTDPHKIDFRLLGEGGVDMGSMWDGAPAPDPHVPDSPDVPVSVLDRMKQARDRGKLQEEEVREIEEVH